MNAVRAAVRLVSSLLPLALTGLVAAGAPAVGQTPWCGERPDDWCAAPAGDPCGRHRNARACREDAACYGMPYKGLSTVQCMLDERGFASNCPTVGCISTPPPPPRK